MNVYLPMIAMTFVLGCLAQYNNRVRRHAINIPNNTTNYYGFSYIALFAMFVFVGGFRYMVGADYGSYFRRKAQPWSNIWQDLISLDEPILAVIVNCCRFFVDNGFLQMFVFALLTTLFIFKGISNYDDNEITLSLLLYILIGAMGFSYNGVRQGLALAFVFAFSKKSEKNWVLKYIIIVLIAFLIHKSTIIMLPLLILSNFKITKRQIWILVACAIIIPLFFNITYDYFAETSSTDGLSYIQHEVNILRVPVAFAPLILIFAMKDKRKFIEENYFLTNMAYFHALVVMSTANSAMLNRFGRMTDIFLIVFIPKALKMFEKKYKLAITLITLLCYFIYWRFEVGDTTFKWIFGYLDAWQPY